ncbi:MAG: anti-sigma factor [Catenulisporales bacterium]|nr:anti-sigma factor [Catenulisporales bacterium]
MGQQSGDPQDFVEVRIPAEGAYLSVLRTATAGLAARLDFTLDEIEDLRIAVDEACAILLTKAVPGACAILLTKAVPGSGLTCRFELRDGALAVDVSVPTLDGRPPARDTFAWTVLAALAGQVDARVSDAVPDGPTGAGIGQTVTISMLKQRGVGAS